MLYRRSDFTTACAVENGSKVFVMGGFTNDMETYELFTSDVEVLIVADGYWKTGPQLNIPRFGHASIYCENIA